MIRSRLAALSVAAGVASALATAAALGAPPPARREVFELSTELEARVTVHQELVNNAGRSAEDFCKLAADTVQILDPVVRELARFGGSEHQSIPFEAVERAYLRTQRLVPGLLLVATAEVTKTGIDYRELAKMGPSDARPLLRAMADFEMNGDGVESWGVRAGDSSVCAAPERGRAALATLIKSWSGAPGCLREALRPRLGGDLERMTTWTCFCADKEAATAAIRKSARLLSGFPDLHGADLANRWVDGARAGDARFKCRPD